jgi:hypothetical protein
MCIQQHQLTTIQSPKGNFKRGKQLVEVQVRLTQKGDIIMVENTINKN